MARLSSVSFRREARWLLVLTLGVPTVAMLAAVVVPALTRALR